MIVAYIPNIDWLFFNDAWSSMGTLTRENAAMTFWDTFNVKIKLLILDKAYSMWRTIY